MTYTILDRVNAESKEIEYLVVDSNGIIAPPPHGGPFSSKATAEEHRTILQSQRSIEEWIAAHPERRKAEQTEGQGSVLHIAPDGRWIQNKGRNTFAVYPSTDLELEIDELVSVSKSGEIEFLDRGRGPGMGR